MSLFFLNSDDFEVNNGQLVCRGAATDLALVFFYRSDCPHCKPVMPLMHQLAKQLHGCRYAIVNVKESHPVLAKAKMTETPIRYVPLLLLFKNGRPIQQYKAPTYSFEQLRDFILEASKVDPVSFASHRGGEETAEFPPEWSDEVCYLSFDQAFNNQEI